MAQMSSSLSALLSDLLRDRHVSTDNIVANATVGDFTLKDASLILEQKYVESRTCLRHSHQEIRLSLFSYRSRPVNKIIANR